MVHLRGGRLSTRRSAQTHRAVAILDDVVGVERIGVALDLVADAEALVVVGVNVVVVNVVVAPKVA